MLEENGRTEVDIKRYAKVEKIPGGSVEESQILRGVMLNKDVTHPKMRRFIKVCDHYLTFVNNLVVLQIFFLESTNYAFGLCIGIQERRISNKC